MPLPKKKTKFTIPPFDELTMLVFGIPGTGKTRFCAGYENTIFASTEPGTEMIAATSVKIEGWEDFQTLIMDISKEKATGNLGYKSLVIDTVEELHQMCQDYVCQLVGCEHPKDKNDFGKTFGAVTKEWKKAMRASMNLIRVRFISHSKTASVMIKNQHNLNEEVERYMPTFSGNKAAGYLDGVLNTMGYVTKRSDGKHVITFQQSPTVAAKDRTDVLTQLGEIILPTAATGFQTVVDAYHAQAEKMGFEIKSIRG